MACSSPRLRLCVLGLAIALAGFTLPAFAQQTDHSRHAPPTGEAEQDPHAGHAVPKQGERDETPAEAREEARDEPVDHEAMGHAAPAETPPEPTDDSGMDDSGMDHSQMDHSGMDMDAAGDAEPDHSTMDHSAMGHDMPGRSDDLPPTAAPREPIPDITDADRAAAFPDVAGHTVHDTAAHWFAMLNRLETWDADEGNALGWEGTAWVGTDLDRLWIRSEGEAVDGDVESADIELLYGRAVATWWDAVAGIRHEFGEYPSQTFAAVGVMGLAPYMFEVSATAYLGESGQTGANVEAEYETLFTNRLILQSLIEVDAWGKDDPGRGIGSGLSKIEAGFRLRYEFDRRFAPYIGVVHERLYGGTADLRRADGHPVDDTRVVLGLRTWF